MTFQLFIDSLIYVMNQPLFWASMGFTTSIAMFIGVLLYDGNTKDAYKGIISVGSYAVMLIWTTSFRIFPIIADKDYYSLYVNTNRFGMAFAGIATITYITLFWLLGIFIGVQLFKYKHYKLK